MYSLGTIFPGRFVGDVSFSPAEIAIITTLLGCLGTVVTVLFRTVISQYEHRISEYKTTITSLETRFKEQDEREREQTDVLRQLGRVVAGWSPEAQLQRYQDFSDTPPRRQIEGRGR